MGEAPGKNNREDTGTRTEKLARFQRGEQRGELFFLDNFLPLLASSDESTTYACFIRVYYFILYYLGERCREHDFLALKGWRYVFNGNSSTNTFFIRFLHCQNKQPAAPLRVAG